MEQRLKILNAFWSNQDEIRLIDPFIYLDKDKLFKGKIELDAFDKEGLLLDVKIPLSYPFSTSSISIQFIVNNIKGIRHTNPDNSICIHTPKNESFEKRLIDEVKLLKEWRDRFYIVTSPEVRYEYLNVVNTDYSNFIFTDFNHDFKKGDWGNFKAHKVISNSVKHVESPIFYILQIGQYKCHWSEVLLNIKKDNIEGFFFFIGDEPIGEGRWNADNWKNLERYFTSANKEKLYQIKNSKNRTDIFILLGYNIPGNIEIHWQILRIQNSEIPVQGKKIYKNYYEYEFFDKPIHWGKTINGSYNRFFGRGALNYEIANKKILIIGVGAIGSALAKILVRSGCKNVNLCDEDSVESGNICRAEFFKEDISIPKYFSVGRQLYRISPFVNVEGEGQIDKILEEPFISKTKERLNQYDIIFDCTSDMELAVVLDRLRLNSTVINISISNGAKELICVAGVKNIAAEKTILFKHLDQSENELIYEGTGCWSPTFSASFFDINCLLNLAVKNLNKQFSNIARFNSFIISTEDNGSSINLKTVDY